MVLVDTSIWIRYSFGQVPVVEEVHRLLGLNQVGGHELVYGELLIGDRGGRAAFLSTYEGFQHARLVPHREVVDLVRRRHLHGRGAGWIDIHLLAAALVEHWPLWTADPRLAAIAKELGMAYRF